MLLYYLSILIPIISAKSPEGIWYFNMFFHYDVSPSTWFYLSSLMLIGIFFKFYRAISVRNLDLLSLLVFGPSMLMLMNGCLPGGSDVNVIMGYIVIFLMTLLFIIRMLLDCLMVRRPLLEPNLNSSGLRFTCISLALFLAGSIAITVSPLEIHNNSPEMENFIKHPTSLEGALRIEQLTHAANNPMHPRVERGPGYPWFQEYALKSRDKSQPEPTQTNGSESQQQPESTSEEQDSALITPESPENTEVSVTPQKPVSVFNESQVHWTKFFAVIGQLVIIAGIVAVGTYHFGNFDSGVAAAVFYLLLPYCYQFQTRLDHIIPAGFIIWAVVFYRRPWISGLLLGFATSLIYYPFFLIPLWIGFYWRRGAIRFTISLIATVTIMGLSVLIFSHNHEECVSNMLNMMGFAGLFINQPQGFWEMVAPDITYKIPIVTTFCGLSFSLIFWPPQKNLGVLLSCSAAILMGAQLVHPFQGGLYMAWYLPVLILAIFRPNLEDRVATSSVFESRFRIIPRAPQNTNPPENAEANA